jgi:hypothetical protein
MLQKIIPASAASASSLGGAYRFLPQSNVLVRGNAIERIATDQIPIRRWPDAELYRAFSREVPMKPNPRLGELRNSMLAIV